MRPWDDAGFLSEAKKSRQRPTLARASPALPSAMEPLTSVFGMGTGVTAPPWSPAKSLESGDFRELQRTRVGAAFRLFLLVKWKVMYKLSLASD